LSTREIPIFPLSTVLFPGGMLPLRIFEQRYLEMTKICIRDNSPFGVCLIREGHEVGNPAVPNTVGCTAHILRWDMPHLGLFHLMTEGGSVFRILEQWSGRTGLLHAQVDPGKGADLQYAVVAAQRTAGQHQGYIAGVKAIGLVSDMPLEPAFYDIIDPDAFRGSGGKSVGLDRAIFFRAHFQYIWERAQFGRYTLL